MRLLTLAPRNLDGGVLRSLPPGRRRGRRALPARRLSTRGLLVALNGAMAANALAGSWYAVGGAPGVPLEWLEGTRFTNYAVPGVILGAVVGGSQLLAAVALWRRHPAAKPITQAASAVLVTWIVTQLAMIGYVSPLQPIVFTWALATLALTARLEA